jgi:hypothetical protein
MMTRGGAGVDQDPPPRGHGDEYGGVPLAHVQHGHVQAAIGQGTGSLPGEDEDDEGDGPSPSMRSL